MSKALVNGYVRMLARDYMSDPRHLFFATLCPGWVKTRMGGESASLTVEQGVDTPVWLATADMTDVPNGAFWHRRTQQPW